MKNLTFVFCSVILIISSCAKIYNSPEAEARAKTHKIIAIAPPKVSIAASKKVDAEAIKEQQKTESVNFQKEMYSWMVKRKMQNRISVEVMDVETTNAKLKKAGYFDDNAMTPSEMCDALGVDGLMTSSYSLSKPMSEGAAVAVGILVGVWGSTNNTTVSLEIHDRETKKLIWNYNHKASGSVGSSPAQLVDNLMRNASKKMPYSR
ncbi:MAG TPA: hypothetical protein PLO67_20245 [Saprospiraceae bacterium]|nr:hypothetical protein [Saprospiraceae bacterium]HPI08498.1 hypothetical protein [Saprospiraceae bacterium]